MKVKVINRRWRVYQFKQGKNAASDSAKGNQRFLSSIFSFYSFSFLRSIWTRSVHTHIGWSGEQVAISSTSNHFADFLSGIRKSARRVLGLAHIPIAIRITFGGARLMATAHARPSRIPVCVCEFVCVHTVRGGGGGRCVPKRKRKSPSIEF